MLSYNTEILTILQPRRHEQELHGYYGGIFNPDKTKFAAFTYVPLDEIDFEEYSFILTSLPCSSTGADPEKTKKYLDRRRYQMKSTEECIKEGIYRAYSMKFYGVYYEGEWFIINDLIFFGEQMNEERAKAYLNVGYSGPEWWNLGSFGEAWSITMPGTDKPIRNVEQEEFPGMPWLVSNIKIEQKTNINSAFSRYMNVRLVQPFLRRIRIVFFDEFTDFQSLFGEDYYLLYPESKTFFLIVAMARHSTLGHRLVWFFCEVASAKFYRWTYPQPRYSGWSYHYAEDVIMDIQDISNWNDFLFLNSSRTMDDPQFWSEYVLKKEEGQYRWLEEISD